MDWIKDNLLRLSTVMILTAISVGGLYARQSAVDSQLSGKADKEAIVRELNQINTRIGKLDDKMDTIILRQSGSY